MSLDYSSRVRDITGRGRSDEDQKAGTKTGDWLLTVDELARELKTTPEHIKLIAGRSGGVTLSWVSTKGDVISRHELPVWRRVVEESGKND